VDCLSDLPLGFWLEQTDTHFVLKCSEDLRLDQLKNDPHKDIKFDPWAGHGNDYSSLNFSTLKCNTTKEDLMNTITSRHISLTPKQMAFLDRLDQQQEDFEFYNTREFHFEYAKIKSFAFRALQRMAEAIYSLPVAEDTQVSTEQDPYLGEFIDMLAYFSDIYVPYFNLKNDYPPRKISYLNHFILTYLKGIKNGKEFYGAEERDLLRRFIEQTIKKREKNNELDWFLLLDCSHITARGQIPYQYHYNFFETAKGLFYFFDYFKKTLGLSVPSAKPRGKGMLDFSELKDILDCISLSGYRNEKAASSIYFFSTRTRCCKNSITNRLCICT
jgi:hypothetical protein